ncbi:MULTISPECIES: GNAT family N-acetyltransferase [Nostocaceae]|nr:MULTISPECIES: N-acetyltransferase [Nostocaceae]HBW29442.1 N-acetyltransferase [Nostoc sp. UBA8866]MBD2170687.1 N-acetyltransferase [Anabaena cylindrica FACHB-318]MBD2262473.1 N-acetyltransferase [Anabaena sp. FACHB-709]MBD2272020.1 N-acetyltransferase [Nostoc sp. PCC 7120 = FACHB-418]MBD2282811.1 N-acetyltransferase [Anabaena cylindrica FACHB-170]
MNIRCETDADYLAISEVNNLSFGQENETQLIDEIRISEFYIPELSLIYEINHIVVWHILFSYIELVGEENLQVLGLAPMAVHPEFQRKGIGSALVKTGLEKADARGESLVIVLGYPQFYSRFGFIPSVNCKIESPFPVPDDVFMVKTLQSYQEKYQGKVIYPPAFSKV